MATNYSDGGLVRGSRIINVNAINYVLKSVSFDRPVRSSYEFDEAGLPKASSHVRDFKKFSGTIMAYNNVADPAQMVKFGPINSGDGNTNYMLLNVKKEESTEGVQSYSVEAVEVIA
jgi:hypothetical protein